MDIEIPAEVFLYHGSQITGYKGDSAKRSQKIFKDFFGCSPDIAAEIWALLLLYTDFINAKSCPFYFLCGLLLLKMYNTEEQLAGMAGCHPDTFRKWAWYYVHAISYLEGELILLEDRFIGKLPNQNIFLSIDGVDFKIWEPESDWHFKPDYCSHKHKSAGLRYEVALCIRTGDCVWINGPERAGETDANIFKDDLVEYLEPGEQCEGDGHYQMMVPNLFPKRENRPEIDMANAIRARHETFNGKVKNFAAMANTFRHGAEHHAAAFRACVVITKLRMDRGEIELFHVRKELIERAIKK